MDAFCFYRVRGTSKMLRGADIKCVGLVCGNSTTCATSDFHSKKEQVTLYIKSISVGQILAHK